MRCLRLRLHGFLTFQRCLIQSKQVESYQRRYHRLQCQLWIFKSINYTIDPVKILTFSVIKAFWVGRHLQQITAGAFVATSKNKDELFVFSMLVNAGPSTNKTCEEGSYSINLVLSNFKISYKLLINPLLLLHRFPDWHSSALHWWRYTWQSQLCLLLTSIFSHHPFSRLKWW